MNAEATYHVAQMNYAVLRHDWDDPRSAGFVDNLARVNAVAERAPGFVWRMDAEDMERPENDPGLVFGANPRNAATVSVWENAEALDRFVHKTVHGKFLGRRDEWFEVVARPSYVIWPVPAGHRPTLAEAKERLDLLAANGASAEAHDFGYLRDGRASAVAAE